MVGVQLNGVELGHGSRDVVDALAGAMEAFLTERDDPNGDVREFAHVDEVVELRWEYDPDEEYVIGGAPPAFVAEVEKQADELVRAAAAFYLDGASYQEAGPKGDVAYVPGGFFLYLADSSCT